MNYLIIGIGNYEENNLTLFQARLRNQLISVELEPVEKSFLAQYYRLTANFPKILR